MCEEEELLNFEGVYGNSVAGTVEVGNPAACLKANGQGTSNLCLSLGPLKKETVDIPKLLKLTRGRSEKNNLI